LQPVAPQQTELRRSLPDGTLLSLAQAQSALARSLSALVPLSTGQCDLEADGLHYLVRILERLPPRNATPPRTGIGHNPFLPFDPDLYVADISETHLCLLNKFNVIDNHLLIVTREYVPQEAPLSLADFEALARALSEVEGLAFFNGGPAAGASQHHKHLQLVPFPLAPGFDQLPITPWLQAYQTGTSLRQLPAWPFSHAVLSLQVPWSAGNWPAIGAVLQAHYQHLLDSLGLQRSPHADPAPYNLLVTRQWMILVPRSQPDAYGISVNALGFAGALLVRSPAELNQLKRIGPIGLLQAVACEWPGAEGSGHESRLNPGFGSSSVNLSPGSPRSDR
jgi:sulfate adenylyltransferase (ADP) / ATP adenylyltransferase